MIVQWGFILQPQMASYGENNHFSIPGIDFRYQFSDGNFIDFHFSSTDCCSMAFHWAQPNSPSYEQKFGDGWREDIFGEQLLLIYP